MGNGQVRWVGQLVWEILLIFWAGCGRRRIAYIVLRIAGEGR